ncbi:MAG: TraR/DksA family transcriptional regulator [Myxococcota bacterium]
MEADDVERWRKLLMERREELLGEGDVKIDPNRRDPSSTPDEDEQPLNEMNQVIASKRNKNRALQLQRITAALTRLREDPEGFGECQECGEPIPERRLELMPWALYCVACQSRLDPRQANYRRTHANDYLD